MARFWSKVRKGDSCWLWTGAPNKKGYGYFSVGSRKMRAHIVAYEMSIGPVPEGLQLDHLCRTRMCVNPDHLEPVSSRVNTLRGSGVTAENSRKTHCKHGHVFDESNTYMVHGKWRMCRACRTQQAASARSRKAESL